MCFTVYVASAFVAGTDVFTTVFPAINKTVAMIIFAAIILVYTFMGGFKAVCWTDFFQGFLMLAAVLAVPILAGLSGDTNPEYLKEVICRGWAAFYPINKCFNVVNAQKVTNTGANGIAISAAPSALDNVF